MQDKNVLFKNKQNVIANGRNGTKSTVLGPFTFSNMNTDFIPLLKIRIVFVFQCNDVVYFFMFLTS